MRDTGTGGTNDTTTIADREKANFAEQKRGAWRLPFFADLLCRLGSALTARMFRERLAPQERCAQLWFSSKPGGVVIIPPELVELTGPVYSRAGRKASPD